MEWKDRYSVGIQEIDDQHRHLLKLFVRIEQSSKLQRGWRDVIDDLVDLKICARRHFEFEEGLMRMYGFREADAHMASHQHFFNKLAEIERKAIGELVQGELIGFLCEWLKQHILGEDRGYADYILSAAPVVKSSIPALAANVGTGHSPHMTGSPRHTNVEPALNHLSRD